MRQGLGVSKGMPRNGQAGCGEERRGIARFLGVAKAWYGVARFGTVGTGEAPQGFIGVALVWCREVWHGAVGLGAVRTGVVWQGIAGFLGVAA